MNKDITLDSQTLKSLYGNNKQYVMPFVMFFVSLILIFVTILPQFNDLLSTLSQREDETAKLQILKNNLIFLTNTDETTLNFELETSLKALPQTKDFESVLKSISLAASKAGVGLGNFEFKVGNILKTESGNDQLPSLAVKIIINDGVGGAARFMTNLATLLPISEVKSVDINGNYTNLNLVFYYKNLPSIKVAPDVKLVPLSSKQTQLLKEISSWDSGSTPFLAVPELESPTASPASNSSVPF